MYREFLSSNFPKTSYPSLLPQKWRENAENVCFYPRLITQKWFLGLFQCKGCYFGLSILYNVNLRNVVPVQKDYFYHIFTTSANSKIDVKWLVDLKTVADTSLLPSTFSFSLVWHTISSLFSLGLKQLSLLHGKLFYRQPWHFFQNYLTKIVTYFLSPFKIFREMFNVG